MKKGTLVLVIVLVIAAVLVGAVVSKYNQLIELETAVEGKWAQVENQLQRRADLIPNLVSTVKGYAAHEEKVFSDVVNARARLLDASTPEDRINAEAGVDSALGRLLALSEAYPELKADANFIRLQDELAGTESRIATERMRFNEAVQTWNATIKKFPTSILAGVFGKEAKAFFEIEEGAREVPQVQF